MENYEKISIITIFSSLFFKYVSIPYFIIFFLSIVSFACLIYFRGKNYIFIFFLLPPLIFPIFNYTKPLFLENVYNLVIEVGDGEGKVEKINYRNTEKFYILKNKKLEELEGRYLIKFKTDKIKKFYSIEYLEGEILDIKKTFFGKWRDFIKDRIRNTDYSYDLEAFSYGVGIGNKNYITEEMKGLFQRTGASHLLAVSGMHFGIVIAVFLFIFSRLSFSYRVKYVCTLIGITFFFLIVSGSPSVWRAYIMGVIFLLSKLFFEKNDNKKSFSISLIFMLIMNYTLVSNIAFQMSFLAIFAIFYLFERSGNDYLDIILCSFFIQIALSPVFIYYFNNLPIFAFLTNILVVFIGSITIFMIYINIFISFFHLEFIIKNLVELSFDIMHIFIKFLDNIPYLIVELRHSISIYFLIALFLALFLYPFIYKKNRIYYLPYFILMLALYFKEPYIIIDKNDYIYFPKEKILVINGIMGNIEKKELISNYKTFYIFSPYEVKNDKYISIKKEDKVRIGNISLEYEKSKIIYKRVH
jgi:competence protein ComEC